MINCQDLNFSYPEGSFQLHVDSFQVQSNEQVAIVGSSGSGKTTLLYLLAGIHTSQGGSVTINDIELSGYGQSDRQDFRIATLGLVFQEFDLKKSRYPHQLSQGERQRVAGCRAMINQPKALLCDEPTGNLDPASRDQVLDLLFDYCKEKNIPMVLVTHDYQILDRFTRVVDIAEFA